MTREDPLDPLDAYMATLVSPASDPSTKSMAQARAECATRYSTGRGSHSLTVAAKNRRYQRLQQLLKDTSEDHYFSDDMMQQRSPALFHFYLGQYVGIGGRTRPVAGTTELTLSTFLIDTHQRSEMEARRVAEQATWGQFSALNEKQERKRLQKLYEADNIEEEEEEEEEEQEEKEQDFEQMDVAIADTVDERRQQLEEIMSIRFLNGADKEYVNYAEIDEDENLDDFVAVQRDAEDRYFAGGTS
ncbi:unnamed protein product [Hyaloperonospora brassicae]|uniref:CCD97-like C-terminal domain-containing protein n=1 Tax=Hyaloperonospora brassicae TaxID=162125 RepID=A0AAV0UGC1_HYABA|nr:unnamed protein product [Hyaloperonospora brassicae]